MNDLTFTSNLESWRDLRFPNATKTTTPAPYQADGRATDTYVEGSNASCSVSCVSAGSAASFWTMMFRLFGFD